MSYNDRDIDSRLIDYAPGYKSVSPAHDKLREGVRLYAERHNLSKDIVDAINKSLELYEKEYDLIRGEG